MDDLCALCDWHSHGPIVFVESGLCVPLLLGDCLLRVIPSRVCRICDMKTRDHIIELVFIRVHISIVR